MLYDLLSRNGFRVIILLYYVYGRSLLLPTTESNNNIDTIPIIIIIFHIYNNNIMNERFHGVATITKSDIVSVHRLTVTVFWISSNITSVWYLYFSMSHNPRIYIYSYFRTIFRTVADGRRLSIRCMMWTKDTIYH